MVKKSINRFAVLSKLSELENEFKQELAKAFLEHLETLPFKKRVKEIEVVLYETEVKRVVTIDQRLSKQEKKCLYWAYKGKNVQETATILNIQPKTVEEYRSSLLKKLNAKTIGQAIGLSMKNLSMIN